MKIEPLHDFVLVVLQDQKSEGGIILPANALVDDKVKMVTGEVLAVGPGRLHHQAHVALRDKEQREAIPVPVKKGDRVIFRKITANAVEVPGAPGICFLVMAGEILAKVIL